MTDMRSTYWVSRETDTSPAVPEADWVDAVVDLKKMTTVIRRSWSKVARARLLGTAGDGCAMDQSACLSQQPATGFVNVTLCSIIAGIVERLGDLEAVQLALRDLRRMQAEQGRQVLDIAAGRVALTAALRQVLGPQYSGEIEAAWMQLYDLIAAALDASPRQGQDDSSAA